MTSSFIVFRCRVACLKLHEDSTHRLRESLLAEKEKLGAELSRQVTEVRGELAAVQEEYVVVCGEKEKLEQEIGQVREGGR